MEHMSRRDFLTVICLLLGTGFVGPACSQETPATSDTHTTQLKPSTQAFLPKSEPQTGPSKSSENFTVAVDSNKCNGCGECVDVCPVDVFELVDKKSNPVNARECLGCESCIEVCSNGAITVREG